MKTKACLTLFTLSLIALVLMCGLGASAQDPVAQQPTTSAIPNLIRYGGVLKDADGVALASQTLGITFALYKQQNGGIALWTETRNVTTDAAGQYNVMLGSTKSEGVPAELFSDQEQRYLAVQVQGQPEPTRVLLVSVPYAFKAHEAETLGGLPPSAFVRAPSADSAGDASTDLGTGLNSLNGVANTGVAIGKTSSGGSALPPAVGVVNGPCFTPGPNILYIPIFANPAGSIICNSVIYQGGFGILGPPGPNVGIGMVPVAPARLDVNGGATEGINTTDNKFAYMISHQPVLSIFPLASNNLFVGVGAGPVNTGFLNSFFGADAGFSNAFGGANSFFGSAAGYSNVNGDHNAFFGEDAGFANVNGFANAFFGADAGHAHVNGNYNAFFGVFAGSAGLSGNANTFVGFESGAVNTADNNTFVGYQSGFANISGVQNTFVGFKAGLINTTGLSNVFMGYQAGQANIDSDENTFVGTVAGFKSNAGGNTFLGYSAGSATNTGGGNVCTGTNACRSNTIGEDNVSLGLNAGFNTLAPTTGFGNTYLGAGAGSSTSGLLTDGIDNIFVGFTAGSQENNVSYNIEIGNAGPAPTTNLTNGSNTILIGTEGTQTDTYIAGIYLAQPSAPSTTVVCVDSNGKLFSAQFGNDPHCFGGSSRRFKEQIADMGDSTSKLLQLRPVTFFYKPQYDGGSHSLQYGLIAEEVANVYPELAGYDTTGQPASVKYNLLAPMLLNEFQKQHAVVTAQQTEAKSQRMQIKAQQRQLQTQKQMMLAQQQQIEGLKAQLRLQNAAFQERLSRLESLLTTQMQTAANKPTPATTPATGGLR